jgi:hypothetical protein
MDSHNFIVAKHLYDELWLFVDSKYFDTFHIELDRLDESNDSAGVVMRWPGHTANRWIFVTSEGITFRRSSYSLADPDVLSAVLNEAKSWISEMIEWEVTHSTLPKL